MFHINHLAVYFKSTNFHGQKIYPLTKLFNQLVKNHILFHGPNTDSEKLHLQIILKDSLELGKTFFIFGVCNKLNPN